MELSENQIKRIEKELSEFLPNEEGVNDIEFEINIDSIELTIYGTYTITETYYRSETRYDPAEYGYSYCLEVESIIAYSETGEELKLDNERSICEYLNFTSTDY